METMSIKEACDIMWNVSSGNPHTFPNPDGPGLLFEHHGKRYRLMDDESDLERLRRTKHGAVGSVTMLGRCNATGEYMPDCDCLDDWEREDE